MAATGDELREAGTSSTSADRIAELSAHEDVRVRVLCAKHPNLSARNAELLAADAKPNVRLTLARRADLTDELAFRLAGDASEKVRAEAVQNHDFSRDQLVDLVDRRRSSPVLIERLKASLKDPAFSAELFALPQWRTFASSGTFRHRDLKRLIDTHPSYQLGQLAALATLSSRSMLRLARLHARHLQVAIAGRADLGFVQRLLIMLFGRQWAAARVLECEPRNPCWRAIALLRPQRVISRTRAATTQSRFLLRRMTAVNDQWDLLEAIALNPRTSRWTMKRLAHKTSWAPQAALASRRDLPRGIAELLFTHPAVVLQMLVNPTTPAHVVRAMSFRDPVLSALASIHPSIPLDERLAVGRDGDAPAWLLRRLAADPEIPADDRERLLTWLALGGGTGDVNFDPVTCVGTPGTASESHIDAYRSFTKGVGTFTPLWRSRAAVGEGRGTLPVDTIAQLASDAHPMVRTVAARYQVRGILERLSLDPSPSVSTQAENTLRNMKPAVRSDWRQSVKDVHAGWRLVFAGCVAMVAISIGQISNSETQTTSVSDLQTLYGANLDGSGGGWMGPVRLPTTDFIVCRSRGVVVYAEPEAATERITIAVHGTGLSVSGAVTNAGVTYRIPATFIGSDQFNSWLQLWGSQITVSMKIGGNPSKPLVLQMEPRSLRVQDSEGDC